MPGWINVPVRIETRNKLDALRREKQSYDSAINEMIDEIQILLQNHNKTQDITNEGNTTTQPINKP